MWIFLHESLITVDVTSQKVRDGMDALLHSIANGNHALTAEKSKTLRHLLGVDLSARYKSIISSALSKYPEIQGQAEKSIYKIRIINDDIPFIRMSNENLWEISLTWLSENELPKSAVLCEDIRDFKLFTYAANHFQHHKKSSFFLSLCSLNGGGANTPLVYENAIEEKVNFVMCITDSDRRAPTMLPKPTSTKCKKIFTENKQQWVTNFYCLPAREIENIIPKNIIADALAFDNNSSCLRCYDAITKISNDHPDSWLYFDLKDGTTIKSIKGHESYWRSISRNRITYASCTPSCLENFICDNEECSCLIAPGLSKSLTETVLNYIESPQKTHKSPLEINKRAVSSDNTAIWFDLGEHLTSWGAAYKKARS